MLLNLLRNILNQTYNLGYYPEDWKQENKIYLKKPGKDSYHDPKSYCPISLTNILGKILERIILNKILHHLESTNFFEGKNLFAYRRFFNTTHAHMFNLETFKILGWCPAGSVLPHGEKVPL